MKRNTQARNTIGLWSGLATLTFIITLGLVAPRSSHAQDNPEKLRLALTALIPGETVEITRGSGDDEVTIGSKTLRPKRVKINNRALLRLLGAPARARLVVVENEIATQVGSAEPVSTGISVNLSEPDLEIIQGQGTEIDRSTEDDTRTTARSRYTKMFATTLSLEGETFGFSLFGLATERDASSRVERDGSVRFSDSHRFSLKGTGNGRFTEEDEMVDVLISGTISASGKNSGTESDDE